MPQHLQSFLCSLVLGITLISPAAAFAKTAIIIPGMFAHEDSRGYGEVIGTLEKRGYTVHTLDIRWWALDMESYSREVKKQLGEIPRDPDTLVVAASLGAFLSLVHLDEITVKNLVFASPAPLFHEYVARSRRLSWTRLVSRLLSIDRARYHMQAACDRVNRDGIRTAIFYATRDTGDNRRFARQLAGCMEKTDLRLITGGHGIRNKKTRKALVQYLATSEHL